MNLSQTLRLPQELSELGKEIVWSSVRQFMRSHSGEVSPMSFSTLWCGVKHLERKGWILLEELTDLVSVLNWQARMLTERAERFNNAAEMLACQLSDLGGCSPAHRSVMGLRLTRALAAQSIQDGLRCRAAAACLSGLAQAAMAESEGWDE